MSGRQLHRCCRVTCYRQHAGNPGGFVYSNPDFFETLTNQTVITSDKGSGLAMKFTIEKTLTKEPNTCTLIIMNLNERSRDDLARTPLAVRIEAGYDGEFRHIFAGDLIRGFSFLKNMTWETTLLVGDGVRAHRFARIPNGKAYRPGTPVLVILKDVVESMGLYLPKNVLVSEELQRQFANGYSISGASRDELTSLLAPFGYRWSVQSGRLIILRDEELADGQAILVSNENWLIGSPEWGTAQKPKQPPELKFESQLYPEIEPGKKIRLESKSVTATLKAIKVKHTAETDGDPWTTNVEAVST